MRSQVYVILNQAFNPNPEHKNWPVIRESGMLGGFLINCENDEKVMTTLQWMAKYNHYAEVKMLSDDEPWPSRADWIKEVSDVS